MALLSRHLRSCLDWRFPHLSVNRLYEHMAANSLWLKVLLQLRRHGACARPFRQPLSWPWQDTHALASVFFLPIARSLDHPCKARGRVSIRCPVMKSRLSCSLDSHVRMAQFARSLVCPAFTYTPLTPAAAPKNTGHAHNGMSFPSLALPSCLLDALLVHCRFRSSQPAPSFITAYTVQAILLSVSRSGPFRAEHTLCH